MKCAVIFNGQGTINQGMGLDFAKQFAVADATFRAAEAQTGYPIREWIENSSEQLSKTKYARRISKLICH